MIPKDVGKFVGSYFQVLGCLLVSWMALAWMLYDRLEFNITFVLLFWAGGPLKKHNPTARIWTLWFAGLAILVFVFLLVHSLIVGDHGARISLAQFSARQMAAVWGVILVGSGVPYGLLLTSQARREFGVEKWQYSLRTFFIVTTIVAAIGGVVGWARGLYHVQVRQARSVLDDYPEIERVWIGTNVDMVLEVEEIYFTVANQPGAVYHSGGIDYVGEGEFRRRLDRALRERRKVDLPDYVTPLDR